MSKYRKKDDEAKIVKKSIVEHFEHWACDYCNMDCESHVHFYRTRNMFRRWGAFDLNDVVQKPNSEKFSESTCNLRLSC